MLDLLVRYGHFIAIFVLFSILFAQHLLVKGELPPTSIKKVAALDMAYGITALAVLLFGLGLWWGVGKPADYYTHNLLFHAKVGLFVLTGILSFVPTRFYLKHRHSGQAITVPRTITIIIRTELVLLLIVALLAVMMAQGVGLNGFFLRQV